MNPPAILDPVITSLSHLYQVPLCLNPLDADPNSGGVQSDHKIVLVKPISEVENKSTRFVRKITVRPFPQSGFIQMENWFMAQTWREIFEKESAHEKAETLQKILLDALERFFPQKTYQN